MLRKLKILLVVIGVFPKAFATAENLDCSVDKIEEAVKTLRQQNSVLEALQDGRATNVDQPLDFIFLVDLDDTDAVSRLKKSLDLKLASVPGSDGLCVDHPSREYMEALEKEKRRNAQLKRVLLDKPLHELMSLTADKGKGKGAKKRVETRPTTIEEQLGQAVSALRDIEQKLGFGQQKWLDNHTNEMTQLDSTLEQIDGISAQFESATAEQRLILFSKVRKHWRELVDVGDSLYQPEGLRLKDVPAIPDFPSEILEFDKEKTLQKRHEDLHALVKNFNTERHKLRDEKKDRYLVVFSRVSKLRAKFLVNMNMLALIRLSGSDYLDDLVREVWAVPSRFTGMIYSKVLEVNEDFKNGFRGVVSLLQKVFFLVLLLISPFFTKSTATKIISFLDKYRTSYLRNNRGKPGSWRKALWMQRVTPYVSWLLYCLILEILQSYLHGTIYEDVNMLLPIAQYYFVYRLFRLFVGDMVKTLQISVSRDQMSSQKLADRTTKIVGRFFLASYSVMHLTEYTVDQGMIYGKVALIMQGAGILVCAFAVTSWHELLASFVEQNFPPRLGTWLGSKCRSRLRLMFCLPVFFLVVLRLFALNVWEWLGEWEVSKRFFARLYRKRIESQGAVIAQGDDDTLPSDYRESFSGEGLPHENFLVHANKGQFTKIKEEIDGWLYGDEDDQSVAIFGEKGIGKTTLLDRLRRSYRDVQTFQFSIPAKTCQKRGLEALLKAELPLADDETLVKSFLEFNKSIGARAIIFVDDAHNLFVGKVGGFAALRKFIEIVNLSTENIFWCVSFNEYSWSYLKGVLGSSDYFRTEIRLSPWTDESIRELITKRHAASELVLSFDRIVMASRATRDDDQATSYAEEQFFRLLWEQSSGNPRVALFLWLNCLNLKGRNQLKVGLPERPKTDRLTGLDDTSWFVFSAIANHENATRREIADATNMPFGAVGHALKVAIEDKLLHKGPGHRYRLGFTYQYDLIRQLKAKNFIYGLD